MDNQSSPENSYLGEAQPGDPGIRPWHDLLSSASSEQQYASFPESPVFSDLHASARDTDANSFLTVGKFNSMMLNHQIHCLYGQNNGESFGV